MFERADSMIEFVLRIVKNGTTVHRKGWPIGVYLMVEDPKESVVILRVDADGTKVEWIPIQQDLMSKDWAVYCPSDKLRILHTGVHLRTLESIIMTLSLSINDFKPDPDEEVPSFRQVRRELNCGYVNCDGSVTYHHGIDREYRTRAQNRYYYKSISNSAMTYISKQSSEEERWFVRPSDKEMMISYPG